MSELDKPWPIERARLYFPPTVDCADPAEDGEGGSQRTPDGARLADRNVDADSAANGDTIAAVLG
jgi:hypothetical protein